MAETLRNWLGALLVQFLCMLILTGFCIVECHKKCGYLWTVLALLILSLGIYVLMKGFNTAAQLTIMSLEFPAACLQSRKYINSFKLKCCQLRMRSKANRMNKRKVIEEPKANQCVELYVTALEKKLLKSCAPGQIYLGSFLPVRKGTYLFILNQLLNWVNTLVVSY